MTKWWKAVAGALALFVLAGSAAVVIDTCLLQKPIHWQKQAQDDQAQPRASYGLLSQRVARVICGLIAQIEPSADTNTDQRNPEPPKWTDRAQAYSAVAVAALTVVLLVITGRQFRLLRQSTRAAENAIQLARKTAATQLRAYVTLDCIDTNHIEKDGSVAGVSFIPVWKNSGVTPARNVQYYTVCDFSFQEGPSNRDFPLLGDAKNRTVIGPNMKEVGPPTRDITASEFKEFAEHSVFICIYGAVNYTDISDEQHRTEFCAVMGFGQGIAGKRAMRFSKTLTHNGADDDCLRAPYAKSGDPLGERT